jgi:hypothetical protein
MRKHDFTLGGVALSLALALTGCGGDDTEPVVQETPSQAPSPTPVSTPTPKKPRKGRLVNWSSTSAFAMTRCVP